MEQLIRLLRASAWSFRNGGRVLRAQSRLKMAFIACFSLGMLGGLYAVFFEGFRFFNNLGGVGLLLVYRLLGFFFWGLGVMLILSGFITSFSVLFRSRETAFLVTQPVPSSELVLYKLVQSSLLSAWAYFFIVIPFVAAYAQHESMGPLFSVWTLLFSVPFVLLCTGLGLLGCLLITRWVPRRALVYGVPALLALGLAALVLRPVPGPAEGPEGTLLLARLVPGLRLSSQPLWPSWWLSEGIGAMVRGDWARGLFFWALLVVNALMLGLVAEQLGRRLFYTAWLQTQDPPRDRRGRRRLPLLARVPEGIRRLAPRDLGALALKDLRVFLRDPAQWTQGLIFFALLGFYFANLRTFRYHHLDAIWRNLVVFLNVFSVSAVMCSFSSRFVYPQLSLEGQAVWVLGLSPAGVGRAFVAKFTVAWFVLLGISVGLGALSAGMLGVEGAVAAVALLLCAALATAVTGLSVGLGALFLDLREQNPSAIVSGFGGTLNLILNLAVMLAVILPMGALFYLREAVPLAAPQFHVWLAILVGWTLALCAACTIIPLRLGYRSLQRREY